jgi:putative MATE family efflux protein
MNPIASLSPQERKRREFVLNGSLRRVILTLTWPLAVYAFFNYLYGFFDMLMVSFIGNNELASVVFIDEIKNAIVAFGGGIAAAGTVIVAREYGAGNIEAARRNAGTSFLLAFLVSTAIVIVILAFGKNGLRWLNAPTEVIETGAGYYYVQMASTAIMAVNSVFIGLEKAKGNTRIIFILNILAMTIKLGLSAWFVYGLGKGTLHVALATLIAQGLLMMAAISVMFRKGNSLRIRIRELRLDGKIVGPILILAAPVFLGKFLFSFGKVIVNGMASVYGSLTIAAFGITMKLDGGAGSLANVFEESETGIIGQNLGAKNLKRAVETGIWSLIFSLVVAVVGTIVVVMTLDWMIPVFVKSGETELRAKVIDIFRWEKFSIFTSAAIAVITGFFIGFKRTKIAFFLNIIRLFAFRIPAMLLFIHLGVDHTAVGYAMFVSNTATMIVAFVIFVVFIHRLKAFGEKDLRYGSSDSLLT